MPNDVIRQSPYPIPCSLRHLSKSFRLGLVLEGIAWEINARSVHVGFDDDVDAADTVEGDFFVLIFAPVAHLTHVFALGLELLVTWAVCQSQTVTPGV